MTNTKQLTKCFYNSGIKEGYHVIAEEKKGISEFAFIQRIFNLKDLAEKSEEIPIQLLDFIIKMCHPQDLTLSLIRIPTD